MCTDYIKLSIPIANSMNCDKSNEDIPVVATIVNYKTLEYKTFANSVYRLNDPTAHAEILAIRHVCNELGITHLGDYDLYVTLEPCVMCAAAISFARIRRLYFGAYNVKSGGVIHGDQVYENPSITYKPEVISGIHEESCAKPILDFFQRIRKSQL